MCHWCSYHIWTSSVIHWTDARQHGIYLFYTIKKQTTTAFLFQNWKADLCPLRTRKKPFHVICCQNENEALSLVAIRSKSIVIGPGKSRHRQLDLNGFPWNENLQRKQNWTAKSTNLKENAGKNQGSFCPQSSLVNRKAWMIPCMLLELKEYPWKTRGYSQHWTPFDSNFEWKERLLVTVEICVLELCGWWFSNQFDKVSEKLYSCRGVGREL